MISVISRALPGRWVTLTSPAASSLRIARLATISVVHACVRTFGLRLDVIKTQAEAVIRVVGGGNAGLAPGGKTGYHSVRFSLLLSFSQRCKPRGHT
jgi:hypothetical protein